MLHRLLVTTLRQKDDRNVTENLHTLIKMTHSNLKSKTNNTCSTNFDNGGVY